MNQAHEERLAAAHAALAEAVKKVSTSDDWKELLRISGSFHRYSPNNQILLAAQGAEGVVASFHTWKKIPATDGSMCRIRKGERALRVFAPIRSKRDVDPDTGEPGPAKVLGYKLVPVFHQGQLVAPPDLPAQPKLLDGTEPPPALWDAVAEQVETAGFDLERSELAGPDGPKGVTKFREKTVVVRNDLPPAQALKTLIHEVGHVLMHNEEAREDDATKDRVEVEAESVAYVVCDILGLDAGEYSIPYVANWSGADAALVEATATRVLAAARQVVRGLEAELGIDLRPNPIADILNGQAQAEPARTSTLSLGGAGTTDQIIHEHLATGSLDWRRLSFAIPAVEAHRAQAVDSDPAGQAIVLAEAGASAEATTAVLRAHGLAHDTIVAALTITVPDELGAKQTLYDRDEAHRAVRAPRLVKSVADELVADLLVSAGRHPAAARQLAETSGQPSNVITLLEERFRRMGVSDPTGNRRSARGLELIDEWSAGDAPSIEQGRPDPQPEPPTPPAA